MALRLKYKEARVLGHRFQRPPGLLVPQDQRDLDHRRDLLGDITCLPEWACAAAQRTAILADVDPSTPTTTAFPECSGMSAHPVS